MAYRLRHIPSGLFYTPNRLVSLRPVCAREAYTKSNLSRAGKCYLRPPSVKQIGPTFYNHLLWTFENKDRTLVDVVPSEWEVVTA